jgi:hypothetical protein
MKGPYSTEVGTEGFKSFFIIQKDSILLLCIPSYRSEETQNKSPKFDLCIYKDSFVAFLNSVPLKCWRESGFIYLAVSCSLTAPCKIFTGV